MNTVFRAICFTSKWRRSRALLYCLFAILLKSVLQFTFLEYFRFKFVTSLKMSKKSLYSSLENILFSFSLPKIQYFQSVLRHVIHYLFTDSSDRLALILNIFVQNYQNSKMFL